MKKKILVVDDNSLVRESLKTMIQRNFDAVVVTTAVDAEDGWWKFVENRPDLVITDLRMETPNSGLILARKIKNISPSTPVIMMSSDLLPENCVDAFCVDAFLEKPLPGIDTLKRIISALL
jgi:DNA-binding NtrC family response regulator